MLYHRYYTYSKYSILTILTILYKYSILTILVSIVSMVIYTPVVINKMKCSIIYIWTGALYIEYLNSHPKCLLMVFNLLITSNGLQ